MKRLFALGLALCLSLPLAHARTLSVIGDREVFGLPADASPERFVEALGEPTVRLPMSGNSQGLLYGNSLLLVFQDGRLAEVRCWRLDRFTDELGLGWQHPLAGLWAVRELRLGRAGSPGGHVPHRDLRRPRRRMTRNPTGCVASHKDSPSVENLAMPIAVHELPATRPWPFFAQHVPGDPGEPGEPTPSREPGEPTLPDEPPPDPVA